MENKTTIELFELLDKFKKESEKENFDKWDELGEASAEIRKREPFCDLFGEKEYQNEFTFEERLKELEEEVKLLKRHKHDSLNGDVLVRI